MSGNMKYCGRCGAQIYADVEICAKCGVRVETMGWICTVCGKVAEDPRGYMQHPICTECYSDPVQRRKWLMQLAFHHRDLYIAERSR